MSNTTTFNVQGMTCGHCVSAVTQELSAIDGVESVDIDLVAGGDSPVTVTSQAPVDESAINAAVTEAGYQVAS